MLIINITVLLLVSLLLLLCFITSSSSSSRSTSSSSSSSSSSSNLCLISYWPAVAGARARDRLVAQLATHAYE